MNRKSTTLLGLIAVLSLTSTVTSARDTARDELLSRDFSAAASKLKAAADRGDADASYQYASLVRRGLGTMRDDSLAQDIYASLAASGFDAAQNAHPVSAQLDVELMTAEQRIGALQWAAQNGDDDDLRRLIEVGVNVNQKTANASTALIAAARNGHLAGVIQLLNASAMVNASDALGDTALIHAAAEGHPDIVEVLVERGADLNHQGLFGNTALLAAAKRAHTDVLDALLNAGADVHLVNANQQTAASVALLSRTPAVAERLGVTQGGRSTSASASLQLDKTNRDGRGIWFVAADRGDVTAIRTLLQGGAAVDQADAVGRTALAIAAERDDQQLTGLLLERGANPNAVDSAGRTPITLAASVRRSNTLPLLLAQAKQQRRAAAQVQTVEAAIDAHAIENLRLLAAAGFRLTDVESAPLQRAARACQAEAMQLLLSAGAEVNAADTEGRTATWFAANVGCDAGLAALIVAGADVTRADAGGETPLHRAASTSCKACVQRLVNTGGETDPTDMHGWTPLMYAVIHHRFDNLYTLAAAGHDLDAVNESGNTALLVSVQRGDALAVEKLLELGAKKRPVNKRRQNAEDVAELFGHVDVSRLLDAY